MMSPVQRQRQEFMTSSARVLRRERHAAPDRRGADRMGCQNRRGHQLHELQRRSATSFPWRNAAAACGSARSARPQRSPRRSPRARHHVGRCARHMPRSVLLDRDSGGQREEWALTSPKSSRRCRQDRVEFDDAVSGVEVKHACLDRKLLITAIGAHTIRMVPPLIVNEEQCDKAVESSPRAHWPSRSKRRTQGINQ